MHSTNKIIIQLLLVEGDPWQIHCNLMEPSTHHNSTGSPPHIEGVLNGTQTVEKRVCRMTSLATV